jgi:hypothetical protein
LRALTDCRTRWLPDAAGAADWDTDRDADLLMGKILVIVIQIRQCVKTIGKILADIPALSFMT